MRRRAGCLHTFSLLLSLTFLGMAPANTGFFLCRPNSRMKYSVQACHLLIVQAQPQGLCVPGSIQAFSQAAGCDRKNSMLEACAYAACHVSLSHAMSSQPEACSQACVSCCIVKWPCLQGLLGRSGAFLLIRQLACLLFKLLLPALGLLPPDLRLLLLTQRSHLLVIPLCVL